MRLPAPARDAMDELGHETSDPHSLTKRTRFHQTMHLPKSCPSRSSSASIAQMSGSVSSLVVVSVGRQVLPATGTEPVCFLLWFATIQCIQSKQDLAGLAPKDCFIPAKPVEWVARPIGQAQKATREVGGGIYRFRRAGPGFCSDCDAGRCSIGAGIDRIGPPESCMDNFLRLWLSLGARPRLTALFADKLRCQFLTADFFQKRQIGLHQLPYDGRSDAFVVVAQNVADARHFLPRNLWMTGLQFIREVAARLGNNLKPRSTSHCRCQSVSKASRGTSTNTV